MRERAAPGTVPAPRPPPVCSRPSAVPVRPDARPAWSGPCRPRVAAAGHAREAAAAAAAAPYLDQFLRGQPRASGGRRRRVVVRVLQLLAGEERCVAGRVRGTQHGLKLREHGLVLGGRRLGRGAQAGAHGQHPRGHGDPRGRGSGRGARIGRALHLAHAGWGGRARRGAAGGGGEGPGRPLDPKQSVFEGADQKQNSSAPPRVSASVLQRPLSPAPPQRALSSPEPALAGADLHERAASARTCPATTDT